MFKYLLFTICLVNLYLNVKCIPEEFREIATMLHNTCTAQTGASDENIAAAGKGNFVEDQNLKCYMKCIGTELATMEDDGTVDEEALLAIAPEDMKARMEPVIKKCGTQVGSDPCDTAFRTNKCWYENAPNDYMLI